MPKIPKKVVDRLSKQLNAFNKILCDAKKRDVNESDTVTIITDMLADLFGFDKYSEVTSEQSIRGTYCDLAVKIDGAIKYLVEVKAIGLTLKDNHLRQVLNYGANHGIPWIVLTNGINWEIHRIKFERPIGCEHTCSINMLELNPRKADDLDRLYLLCKEGLAKDAIDQFHEHTQIVNRFVVAAIMQSDPVLNILRREIRRLAPNAKVTTEELAGLLPDVLKRDVIEGELAQQAERRVNRAASKSLRKNPSTKSVSTNGQEDSEPPRDQALVPPTGSAESM